MLDSMVTFASDFAGRVMKSFWWSIERHLPSPSESPEARALNRRVSSVSSNSKFRLTSNLAVCERISQTICRKHQMNPDKSPVETGH
jgi:hypothetical protein